jgi:hypothetical protein
MPHGSSSRHQASRQLRDLHVPRGPGSRLLAQGSSGDVMCPWTPTPATRPWGIFEAATCPLGSSSRLLAQSSSEGTMCPVGRLYGL